MGSLGLIFASFLSAFKSGAADPVAAATAARAVERLDKMSLVRQQLQRQLNAIMSTYAPFDQRIGQVLGEAYEQRELLALYRLQELMPMVDLLKMKDAILHRGIVTCPTLDDTFRQLNGVKSRLLGPRFEMLQLPHKPKVKTSPPAKGSKGGKRNDDDGEARLLLSVGVVAARNLKEGGAAVFARLACNQYQYKTQPGKRHARNLNFGLGAAFQWNDLTEYHVLQVQLPGRGGARPAASDPPQATRIAY